MKIGSIYPTRKYGPVRVLAKTNRADYYLVQFLRTGTIKKSRGYQIKNGCVRDPYAKSVCGIACTGNIKTKGKYSVYYRIWHDMINRCYNKNNKRFSNYQNVSVSKEWLIFENFYNDLKNIDGFDEKKIVDGTLVLDKDLKQRGLTNKEYSVNTCTWIPKTLNNQIQDSQQKKFYALSPDGITYTAYNITEFAKQHNLKRKLISNVLHNRSKSTHGWIFSYNEIV